MPDVTILLLSCLLFGLGLWLLLLRKTVAREQELRLLKKLQTEISSAKLELSLKERIAELRGEKKPSLLREALRTGGSVLAPLLGIAAFAAGCLFLRSVTASVPLGLAGYLLPVWTKKLRSYEQAGRDDLEVEAALSVITSTYLRTNDLVGAVEENVAFLKPPVRDAFQRFLFEYRSVTPSVPVCLARLKQRLPGATARQWCDLAAEAQNTATVKYAMQSVLNEFRTIREVQSEYNTSLRQSMRDFRTIVLIIAAFLPGLRLYSKEWFDILTGTVAGRAAMSLLLTVMLLGINRSVELQAPLSGSGKEVP